MERRVRRGAALGGGGAVLAGLLALGLVEVTLSSWEGWGSQPVAGGLGVLTTAAAAGASAWMSLVLAVATVTLLRGAPEVADLRRGRIRPGPAPLTRRVATWLLVLGAVGATPAVAGATPPHPVAVVLPVASLAGADGPATVADVGHPGDVAEGSERAPVTGTALPEPGWTPTRAEPAPRPSGEVGLLGTSFTEPLDHVVVHRGDTLWAIAARHLGEQATDQDVAEAWPRWYAANRAVIGDDPDLIRPGQQLVVPSAGVTR
ncbi:LysM domain-containing protein [Ornithinimicrobium cerasi]|uniref:LysM domain-containing protein n=1 Tax=Ornithinimicrobium cerasi TaxID=2248773 RepID=A0A285VED7_9MICO|nr:LysM domain-containing protein [Ornithinimicrobium cerasi]